MAADDIRTVRDSESEFLCTQCASPLVQPVDWTASGENQWLVGVRCPECFSVWDLMLDNAEAQRLVLLTDEAAESMREIAEALDRDIFRESCTVFVEALRADLIRPLDF
jgi:hypothetical protein